MGLSKLILICFQEKSSNKDKIKSVEFFHTFFFEKKCDGGHKHRHTNNTSISIDNLENSPAKL